MSSWRSKCRMGVMLRIVMILAFPIAGTAQEAKSIRYPLSEIVVARWLRANGIEIEPSRIHLPTFLSAATPSPELAMTTTERLGDGHVRLELRCQSVADCLPFNATLDVTDAFVVPKARFQTVDYPSAAAKSPRGGQISQSLEESPMFASVMENVPSHLMVGSQVTLVIDDGVMSIHLPVIAMDGGRVGTAVRVCTPDRKKIFHATVVDGTTVKGVLE
jgi:hypothetical protein